MAYACGEHGMIQHRACAVLGVYRSGVRYRSIRPDDSDLRVAIKAVAADRRRFGYRRIHVMLQRQGIMMNHKKQQRQYREEKLQVHRRGGRTTGSVTSRPSSSPRKPHWKNRPHEATNQPKDSTLIRRENGSQVSFLYNLFRFIIAEYLFHIKIIVNIPRLKVSALHSNAINFDVSKCKEFSVDYMRKLTLYVGGGERW